MLRRTLAFLLLLLPLPAAARPDTIEVPLGLSERGHWTIPVTVNGKGPYDFVFDTGAAGTVVEQSLAQALGLRPTGPAVRIMGMGGAGESLPVTLDSVGFAGATARDVRALIGPPLPPAQTPTKEASPGNAAGAGPSSNQGVLGNEFFVTHVLEVDPAAGKLRLHPPGTRPPSARGWTEAPITLNAMRFPFVDGYVGKHGPVPAFIDTGARRSALSWDDARRAGITPETPGVEKGRPMVGGGGRSIDSHKYTFPELRIGGVSWTGAALALIEFPPAPPGASNPPRLLVGKDFLSGRRFVIDYPAKLLLIEN